MPYEQCEVTESLFGQCYSVSVLSLCNVILRGRQDVRMHLLATKSLLWYAFWRFKLMSHSSYLNCLVRYD